MEKQKKRRIVIVLFGILIPALMFQFIIRGKKAPEIPLAKSALADENNTVFSLSDYKGNVIIVSYFQSWCGDCRRELPELEALQQAAGGEEKLKIFLVSDESWEKINAVKNASKSGLSFYRSDKKLKEIGIRRFPTTYLLDKDGQVAEAKVEGINWNTAEIQEQIKQLNQ
jgi:thiol-disulfide isomerase/thioredoxin